jgi:hypothetical protein
MQEASKDYDSDTLMGKNESNESIVSDKDLRIDLDEEQSTNLKYRQVYNKSIDRFIESSRDYNLEDNPYNLSPEIFTLVSNLDPREVSDEDFFHASKQFSNEDFVRASSVAYLRYEANQSDLNFWVKEVESKKGDRLLLLRQMRNSSKFLWDGYSSWESPMSKLIRQILRKFWFPVLGFARKIMGIQDFEILTTINLVLERNELLLGASIDQPRAGESVIIKTPKYYIVGWALARDIQPTTICLTCGTKTISEVFMSQPRPDVSQAYCVTSNTHDWGYMIELDIKGLPERGDLRLKAKFPSGKVTAIGLIKFQKF